MAAERLRITVAVALPGAVRETVVELPVGSRLGDALAAAAVVPDGEHDAGIWGRARPLDAVLSAGDRVEVYRPLRVDPKTARRERFRAQGARATGLFAGRRAGAKAGY